MNRSELGQLPAMVDVPTAARVLGIGRALAYDLVRSGGWPTPVVRMGKLIRIPTACLQRVLDGENSTGQLTRADAELDGRAAPAE